MAKRKNNLRNATDKSQAGRGVKKWRSLEKVWFIPLAFSPAQSANNVPATPSVLASICLQNQILARQIVHFDVKLASECFCN
ncbi:Hypothetical protein NTJ_03075 [Nesidiocoris tenuis]|uniref:Uncharacterized protein n=1 Tax=Nesidiocoris tenuis TaxID=355587 RepID=A0ABN7AD86_9HEMI|nr:Hypothetical protein NTJ_03075 [Nesidiocoris tenuis]